MNNAPYSLRGPCRRPAGKFVLNPLDSRDGWKGRASWLADNLGGRWSHQAGGYVISPKAAADFVTLYDNGWTGCVRVVTGEPARFQHDAHGFEIFTRAQALKLCAQPKASTL